MARWRLMQAHYLPVPGTEWEYKETDRTTGKQGRKVFPVPAFLNPEDPADHNYPGEIVVCYQGKGQGRDIVFTGPPTPDMEPMDAEAEAITEKERPRWVHPIESLPGQGYSQSILSDLERKVDAIAQGRPTVAPSASAEFEELRKQVALLTEQNAMLMEKLDKPERRV